MVGPFGTVESEPFWAGLPSVWELVRDQRFDEALAELYKEAERLPTDGLIKQAIARVREHMAEAALSQLGPPNSFLRPTGIAVSKSSELGADEKYLLGCVDSARTIDALLCTSTLGRYHTTRILLWFVRRGLVQVVRMEAPGTLTRASEPIRSVLLGVGNATQAALARTMLRVSLGRTVGFRTAASANELFALADRDPPGLVVVDYRLPGRGDAIETVRVLRDRLGNVGLPAVILIAQIEHDYARSRVPPLVELLVRPIERSTLDSALERLVKLG